MSETDVLVVGAGPYGVAVAARSRALGLDTRIVGRPMSFWREHMPVDMFLRSGPDWHLDAGGVHTFEAYLAEAGIEHASIDPIPIGVFLGYTDWFIERTGLDPEDRILTSLERDGDAFVARFADGGESRARRVVSATGIAPYERFPVWADQVPEGMGAHTLDLVEFSELRGARVLIVGGRQSAYEWAALAADHGATKIDVVHRHPTPAFQRVSWKFVDPYVEDTIRVPSWWKTLDGDEQAAIARKFWEVGRLTLEWWLTPRLPVDRVTSHAETSVVSVTASGDAALVTLSDESVLEVDKVVYATGYEVDLAKLGYLAPLLDRIETIDGFPRLDGSFQSTVPGLFFAGFATTKEFGPFYGFTKGCPSTALLIGDGLRETTASV